MKKSFIYIFIALLVASVIVAFFSDIAIVDYISYAVAFVSAGALCATTINKSVKKDWKVYLAVVGIGVSCFALGFCGVASDTVTKLISGIVGVIALIIGIIGVVGVKKVADNSVPKTPKDSK